MNDMRNQLRHPLVVGIIGGVIGLLIGWLVIGWWLWPVQYSGATPKDLVPEWQKEYTVMTIQAYSCTGNTAEAIARFAALGENGQNLLADAFANPPSGVSPNAIQGFASIVLAPGTQGTAVIPTVTGGTVLAPTLQPGGVVAQPTVAPTAAPSTAGSVFRTLLLLLCGVVLIAVVVALVLFLLKGRNAPQIVTPAMEAQKAAREAEFTDYSAAGEEPPLAQFMASYKIGDDLFDDSFSIDSPAGEFLGECGVGISETIGVGEPKKVTAFEVWLFDKNDIQTVTKVLMSEHSFLDDATRQRLAARGEPIQTEPGIETILETETLRLTARVVDMGYGDSALPEKSFFDRFILELSIWSKPQA
jgi:hypothetical protein